MSPPFDLGPEEDLANQLAEIAALLIRVTDLLERLAPEDHPPRLPSAAPLSAVTLQLLPVLRQIYVQPATLAVQSLVLALAGRDTDTDRAISLLRRVIHDEIRNFPAKRSPANRPWPDGSDSSSDNSDEAGERVNCQRGRNGSEEKP